MDNTEKVNENSFKSFLRDLGNFQFSNVIKALICSFLNIIIYIILIGLILGFDQGAILFIDLYTDKDPVSLILNISLFHFLTYFLSLIMSLYPTYVYTSLFVMDSDSNADENIKWNMSNWGLISFKDLRQKKLPKTSMDFNPYFGQPAKFWTLKFLEGSVRKFLGIFLFVIWAGLLIHTYYQYQIDIDLNWFKYVIYGFLYILFSFIFWLITVALRRKLTKAKLENYQIVYKRIEEIQKYCIPFFILLITAFVVSVYFFEWNLLNVVFQVIICLLMASYLLLFRTLRKLIPAVDEIDKFLYSIRMMGIVVFIFIVVLNCNYEFAEMINPINVVLAGLIMLYTIVTMWIKLFLYYKDNSSIKFKYFPALTKKMYYTLTIALMLFFSYNLYWGNNLHELQLVHADKEVSIDEFYQKYKNVQPIDSNRTPILYAAYGGGLTAHYWNYLILNHVDTIGQFDNILAMSGVSGGGMGISNYSAMKYLELSSSEVEKAINNVKNTNILSMELSYLFGLDLIREMLPSWLWWGHDRSHRSMTFYNDNLLTSEDLVNKTSFDKVYSTLSTDSHYPNIIINSTATVDRSGIVSAVRTDSMFPGTINLLDINYKGVGKTLTFFEASSTCNRFPGISPAANVPNKGHFVDGGYYENSGVMSLVSFKKGIEDYESGLDSTNVSIFRNKTKLISVRNDKSNYVESLMTRVANSLALKEDLVCNEDFTETKAMLSSILNLERTPTYLRDYLKKYNKHEYYLYFIDLPFYIDVDELDDFFGGTLNAELLHALKGEINKSNDEIERLLGDRKQQGYHLENWGVINPATARLLSRPVVIYMEAMMEHPNVKVQLELIFKSF